MSKAVCQVTVAFRVGLRTQAPLPDLGEGLQGQQALLQQTLLEASDHSQPGAGSTGPGKKHKPGNWAGIGLPRFGITTKQPAYVKALSQLMAVPK